MNKKPGIFDDYGKLAKTCAVVAVVLFVVWYVGAALLGLAGLIAAGGF